MMSRVFLLALFALSCDAFLVQPGARSIATRAAVAPATSAPVMLFGSSKPAKKVAKKAKKVVKKPVKKVAKKVAKKVVKKAGFKGPAAAQPGSSPVALVGDFFSTKNWGVQAVTLLGNGEEVPVAGLAFVGVWVLLVLRFTIFYGLFATE